MSIQSHAILALTVTAASAIAASRFVTPLGAQAGADAYILGASNALAAIGDEIPVNVLGTTSVESGAAVAVGVTIKSDALGRAIPWVTSGGRAGIALEAATAAGQLIEVLLVPSLA